MVPRETKGFFRQKHNIQRPTGGNEEEEIAFTITLVCSADKTKKQPTTAEIGSSTASFQEQDIHILLAF
jgi:hypothetical protein